MANPNETAVCVEDAVVNRVIDGTTAINCYISLIYNRDALFGHS